MFLTVISPNQHQLLIVAGVVIAAIVVSCIVLLVVGLNQSTTPWEPPAEGSECEFEGEKVRVVWAKPYEKGWLIRFSYSSGISKTHQFDAVGEVTYYNFDGD